MPFKHPGRVLHHLLLKNGDGFVPLDLNGPLGAGQDAFAAAHTGFRVDHRFFVFQDDGALGAVTDALPAADAFLPGHLGSDIGMLAEFPFPRGAAHAHVFDGPAEAGQFMSLEMGHADEGVGIDDVGGNGNGLEIFFH